MSLKTHEDREDLNLSGLDDDEVLDDPDSSDEDLADEEDEKSLDDDGDEVEDDSVGWSEDKEEN